MLKPLLNLLYNPSRFHKYPKNMGSISGQGATDTKEVNRNIKRYRDKCKKILDNVCKGIFP